MVALRLRHRARNGTDGGGVTCTYRLVADFRTGKVTVTHDDCHVCEVA
jgi:hypothetical protein